MDQALLQIHNELLIDNLSIYWVSDYCYKCLEQELISVQMNRTSKETHFVAIDTQHALTLKVNNSKEGKELCRIHYHFGEYGNYSLRIRHLQSNIMNVTCDIIINQSPFNSYLRTLL
uniref:Uncharacterized protein n=1 Tax=Laticauda laticaudata TaxID=8630 RepID=A0A8C5RE26_LATLA